MPTGSDVVSGALRLLMVIRPDETPSAEDLRGGLSVLNELVDSWALERLTKAVVTRHVHPLTANVGTYTIGSGATLNQVRPETIERVSVILDRAASPVVETPLGNPLSLDQYQAISLKAQTGDVPASIYYDYGYDASGYGTIIVYPTPTVSTVDLVLYTPTAFAQFANATTDYGFPPGVARTMRYNLALELAPLYERPPSPDVQRIAVESLNKIKRANVRMTELASPLAGSGRYNIVSDR